MTSKTPQFITRQLDSVWGGRSYNRSFDFNVSHIGLKYNETWHEPVPEVKPKWGTEVVRKYVPFISHREAMANDWMECRNVDGLKVQLPDLGERHPKVSGRPIMEPITSSAKDLRLVILPNQELDDYFMRFHKTDVTDKSRFGVRFIVLDTDGVWNYQWDRKEREYQIKPWSREGELKGVYDLEDVDEPDSEKEVSNLDQSDSLNINLW